MTIVSYDKCWKYFDISKVFPILPRIIWYHSEKYFHCFDWLIGFTSGNKTGKSLFPARQLSLINQPSTQLEKSLSANMNQSKSLISQKYLLSCMEYISFPFKTIFRRFSHVLGELFYFADSPWALYIYFLSRYLLTLNLNHFFELLLINQAALCHVSQLQSMLPLKISSNQFAWNQSTQN